MYDPGHCNDPTTARQLLPAKEKKMDGNGNGDGEMGEEYKSILLSIVVLCFGEKGFFVLLSFKAKACESPSPIICPRGGTGKKRSRVFKMSSMWGGRKGGYSRVQISRGSLLSLYKYIFTYLDDRIKRTREREKGSGSPQVRRDQDAIAIYCIK